VKINAYKQLLLNVWFALLAYCLANCLLSIAIGELSRVLIVLGVGALLLFVVIQSSALRRIAVEVLRAIFLCVFALAIKRSIPKIRRVDPDLAGEPSLSPLFQRPPPMLLL
jgi:hypothetical protein